MKNAVFALFAVSPFCASCVTYGEHNYVYTSVTIVDDQRPVTGSYLEAFNEALIAQGVTEDRDTQPLVRINPTGFERCIDDDFGEERVRLQFDVTPDGNVVNVEAFDSTNRCYDRYAVRAAQRWKYLPKLVDGQAVSRRGVQTTMVFSRGR